MTYDPKSLHDEIEDLFSTLSGIAEISGPGVFETIDTLHPLPAGRMNRPCKWVPPRRRYESEKVAKVANPEVAAERFRTYWANLPEAERRARVLARPALTPTQAEAKRLRERARYAAKVNLQRASA